MTTLLIVRVSVLLLMATWDGGALCLAFQERKIRSSGFEK